MTEKLNLQIIENYYPLKTENIHDTEIGKAFSNSPLMHRGQLKFLIQYNEINGCEAMAFNFPMYTIIQKN